MTARAALARTTIEPTRRLPARSQWLTVKRLSCDGLTGHPGRQEYGRSAAVTFETAPTKRGGASAVPTNTAAAASSRTTLIAPERSLSGSASFWVIESVWASADSGRTVSNHVRLAPSARPHAVPRLRRLGAARGRSQACLRRGAANVVRAVPSPARGRPFRHRAQALARFCERTLRGLLRRAPAPARRLVPVRPAKPSHILEGPTPVPLSS